VAQGVTAAVLAMARAMQIRSVADGIDDSATLEMLRALGCDEIQGRHVALPMKATQFEHWLETGGVAHLAKPPTAGTSGEYDVPDVSGVSDSAIDDVVKWVNG